MHFQFPPTKNFRASTFVEEEYALRETAKGVTDVREKRFDDDDVCVS